MSRFTIYEKLARLIFWERLLLCLALLLLLPGGSFAYELDGNWYMEGTGYVEKNFVRARLTDNGVLNVRTVSVNGDPYVTGFSVNLSLNALMLDINAWNYARDADLPNRVRIPDEIPTQEFPFTLPTVTVDGVSYRVTFNSTSSGTVEASGPLDVDYAGRVNFSTVNVIWKEGTARPDAVNKLSGCSAGAPGVFTLALALTPLLLLRTPKKKKFD